LLPLWLARGRIVEGWSWLETLLAAEDLGEMMVAPAVHARALADKALLEAWGILSDRLDQAELALSIAREVGDPALIARALTACGSIAAYEIDVAQPYLAEAGELARELGDKWRLSQVLGWQSYAAFFAGDPEAGYAVGVEGRDLADSIGDRFSSRFCRNWGVTAPLLIRGEITGSAAVCNELLSEAAAASDTLSQFLALQSLCVISANQGDIDSGSTYAEAYIKVGEEFGGFLEGCGRMVSGLVAVAAGDVLAAEKAIEAGWPLVSIHERASGIFKSWRSEAALAARDLSTARRWADDAVAVTSGYHLVTALVTRCRVALAQGDMELADRDAHDALAVAAQIDARLSLPDIFYCIGSLNECAGNRRQAVRMFGTAAAIGQRIGAVPYKFHRAAYETAFAALREAMGDNEFETAWAEGAALSTAEAIGYAQRGRGGRKRPASGWASLTPTELDVVRLVSDGLPNKDIAARLFVSPRTVQTHLTHIYGKLDLTSRVQLAQEAARHD
jgi:DNA-binding CsgD family transcriptional regulator